jgi:hypothetical protein
MLALMEEHEGQREARWHWGIGSVNLGSISSISQSQVKKWNAMCSWQRGEGETCRGRGRTGSLTWKRKSFQWLHRIRRPLTRQRRLEKGIRAAGGEAYHICSSGARKRGRTPCMPCGRSHEGTFGTWFGGGGGGMGEEIGDREMLYAYGSRDEA